MFGIYIHGAMDTFSRRLLWLRVYSSNKDPVVVGSYFFDFIRDENGNIWLSFINWYIIIII